MLERSSSSRPRNALDDALPRHAETTAACVTRCMPPGHLFSRMAGCVNSATRPPHLLSDRHRLLGSDEWHHDAVSGRHSLPGRRFRGQCRLLIVHPADHASDQSIGTVTA
jgi:hypothetical protein